MSIPLVILLCTLSFFLGIAATIYGGFLAYRYAENQQKEELNNAEIITKAAEELALAMLENMHNNEREKTLQ